MVLSHIHTEKVKALSRPQEEAVTEELGEQSSNSIKTSGYKRKQRVGLWEAHACTCRPAEAFHLCKRRRSSMTYADKSFIALIAGVSLSRYWLPSWYFQLFTLTFPPFSDLSPHLLHLTTKSLGSWHLCPQRDLFKGEWLISDH